MKTETVFTYHGGKSTLCKWVLGSFPKEFTAYIEPFFGSGVIFFNSKRAQNCKQQVINEINGDIINFFEVLRDHPQKLQQLLELTPFAREEYYNCYAKLRSDEKLGEIERARCFFVVQQCSFMGVGVRPSRAGFATSRQKTQAGRFINKTKNLQKFAKKIRAATIENLDVLDLIEKYDHDEAFFYLDPPYVLSDCRYSTTYTMQNYRDLLAKLLDIKGKFLMSNYSNIVEKVVHPIHWHTKTKEMPRHVKGKKVDATEILIANYDFNEAQKQRKLF